jgi:hypothetical protein
VRTILKIVTVPVAAAILWLGWSYVRYVRDEAVRCDTLTLYGRIRSETFVAARDCLVRSREAKKLVVIEDSEGGNGAAALALGILIHEHQWDVEVRGVCPSSCADFIFPAGRTKYLHPQSMLLFHGGFHQKNLLESMEEHDRQPPANVAPIDSITLGHEGKEATISFTAHRSSADQQVREFFSIANDASAIEILARLRSASDQFYQKLGVNPLLPTYGQIGAYKSIYESYKYGGFTYDMDSLRRLGIGNIVLKDGDWHPERNPVYHDVYEVTYP